MNKTGQRLSPELTAALLKATQFEETPPARSSEVRLTLKELAHATDVSERTIRFYIQQGVLPPPQGAGPASRYGLEHMTRLSLVRRFKAALLPLSRIKDLLTELGPTQLEQVADQLYNDLAHTNPVLEDKTRERNRRGVALTAPSSKTQADDTLEVFYPPSDDLPPVVPTETESRPGTTPVWPEGLSFGGRWNRLVLAPGLELHYQENGPQDGGAGKQKLAQLVELAMQLYQ